MAKFSIDSLDWLDKLTAVSQMRKEDPNRTGVSMAAQLGVSPAHASYLNSLNDCLDQAAIDKIRQAASPQEMPFLLSLSSARELLKLDGKVTDLPRAIHAALDVILSRRLTTAQIKALVVWMLSGKPAAEFDPSAPKPQVEGAGSPLEPAHLNHVPHRVASAQGHALSVPISHKQKMGTSVTTPSTQIDPRLAVLFQQVEALTGEDKIKAQAQLVAYVAGQSAEVKEGPPAKTTRGKKSSPSGEPSLFWEWILGVKFMSQLKSKAKKGQLTTNEKLLILVDKGLVGPVGWVLKHLGKLFKETAKDFWLWAKHTLGKTFSQIIQWAIPLIIICALIWGLGKVYQWVVVTPLHWIESEVKSGFHWGVHSEEQTTPVSAPPPVASASRPPAEKRALSVPISHKKENGAPTQTYQPSVSFAPPASPSQTLSPSNSSGTLYDPKLLEQEIAALPQNCIVTAFPVSPDEGIPGDLAATRIQDVTDPDKYTLMIGGAKQKIENITAATTGLILNYKNTDVIDFLNTGGTANVIWEDMLYIHTDKIDIPGNNPSTGYDCTVIGSGAKNALTFRCNRADDLKHLVSALEYFIRNSRLGHDTALAGMPFPSQGLRFNGIENVINLLWANSPADKAGLALGDHLWSIGKITSGPQGKNDLENGLQSLPITLFVVSPAEWEKALTASRVPGQSLGFRPKLRKIVLNEP